VSPVTVSVPERGHKDLSSSTWSTLTGVDEFWSLVDKKMVKVSQPGRGRIRLDGTSWVGRIQSGDVVVELVEKIPGVLSSLLWAATDKAFRIEKIPAPATPPGPLMRILVHEFLQGMNVYTASGRQFRYTPVPHVSSLMAGKIRTTATVRLRAQGLRHLVAFYRDTVDHATPKNRVLAAGIRQVLRLAEVWGITDSDVFAARMLDELFSDCKDAQVLFGDRRLFADYAEQLIAAPLERDTDLLRLASVILASESFEPSAPTARSVPRTWFLNLETLFETAVRNGLKNSSGLTVTKPAGARRNPIFKDEGLFLATPDLLVSSGPDHLLVGDVKYKNYEGLPEAQDVYQLLAHASAYEVQASFLAYPGEAHQVTRLGEAAGGTVLWVVVLDVRDLAPGLGLLLDETGIGATA
jgi:5-methylcytosine-specific restriction endonuclease McrBC regulatory subunit McrC